MSFILKIKNPFIIIECKKEGPYNILMQYYVMDICVNIVKMAIFKK